MKCVIQIGYMQYLLPDLKDGSKVMEILAKGLPCRYYGGKTVMICDEEKELELKVVPADAQFTDESERPVDLKAARKAKADPLQRALPQKRPSGLLPFNPRRAHSDD